MRRLFHIYTKNMVISLEKLRGCLHWRFGFRAALLLRIDRKKPLYYRRGVAALLLPEIKALRAMVPDVEWQVREQSVYDYLSLRYLNWDGFEGVARAAGLRDGF